MVNRAPQRRTITKRDISKGQKITMETGSNLKDMENHNFDEEEYDLENTSKFGTIPGTNFCPDHDPNIA